MRTLGIIAIFVLTLVSIVEGAFLIKLSRQVSTLSHESPRPELERDEESAAPALRRTEGAAPRLPRAPAPGSVPTFQTLAPPSTTPATTTLREALATSEGREQLKAAMEVIAEEKRQARLVEQAPRRDEREKELKERIMKAIPLTGDEPLKLATLFTNLQNGRRQILEDMKAGLKNAEQADDEIDELRDGLDGQIQALVGEERWRKYREQRRRSWGDRGGGQGQGGQGQAQAQAQTQGQSPSVAAGSGR
jgi:hypothetical protein